MAAAVETATRVQRLCVFFLFVELASVVSLVLWAGNKGFELSDESYYCLSSAYPHSNGLLNSYFGLITHRLCAGVTGVVALRYWHLFYQLTALVVFAVCFLRYVTKKITTDRLTLLLAGCALVICGFLNYDYLPMTMSYNSWSLILALFFFAGALSISDDRSTYNNVLFLVMGALVALLFYNKMPNGVAAAGLFSLQLLLFERRHLWRWSILGGLGAMLGSLALFGSVTDVFGKTDSLLENLFAVRGSSVGQYSGHLRELLTTGPARLVLVVGCALLLVVYLLRRLRAPVWLATVLIIGNLLFCFCFSGGNGTSLSNDYAMLFVVTASAAASCIFFHSDLVPVSREAVFVLVSLYLMPFLLAAGTSNVIFYTASQAGVFAVAAILFGLLLLQGTWPKLLLGAAALVLTANVCIVLFNGMLRAPYRQSDLREKNIPLVFSGTCKNVIESPERYLLLASVTAKLKKWNGDARPVLASPPCLGSVVLAGMHPHEVYWIADPERYATVNKYYFPKMRSDTLPFLLLSEEIIKSGIQVQHLRSGHIDIARDYTICDSTYLALNDKYFYFCKPLR